MPTIVIQMKEEESQPINTSVPSLNSLGLPTLMIVDKNATELHIGKEASPIPIPPSQGEV